jgi:thiamine biosynthesis lipoprotein
MIKKIIIAALSVFLLASCSQKAQPEISRTDFVLGTVCTIRLIDGGSTKTNDEIFARLREIDDNMSANKEGTDIAHINEAAGGQPVTVHPDTFFVISKALEYAAKTGGAFDPTVGPLVKLWNIGNEGAKVPPQAEIDKDLKLIGYKKVQLDPKTYSVRLEEPGMRLDLGAIAKGYAADECAKILAKYKVKAAIIDLGGNVLAYGQKRDKTPWKIGVQNPKSERGQFFGLVTGDQMTVVTSGVYERFFIQDGKRYHHILDTKTGYPVDNGLVSTTIITQSSIDADALSTSVFALGIEKGMALVKSIPGVYAVFLDDKNKVYMSPGTNKIFSITDPTFTPGE